MKRVNKKHTDGQNFCKCGHKELHHNNTGSIEFCRISGCLCTKFVNRNETIKLPPMTYTK